MDVRGTAGGSGAVAHVVKGGHVADLHGVDEHLDHVGRGVLLTATGPPVWHRVETNLKDAAAADGDQTAKATTKARTNPANAPHVRVAASRLVRLQRASMPHATRDQKRTTAAATRPSCDCSIARKGIESSQRLGRHRWIVESCLSWLQHNRRLVRRYDRKPHHFQTFADLGCILLCYRRLLKNHLG